MNFRGRTQRNLDAKGRIMLPTEHRDALMLRLSLESLENPAEQNSTEIKPEKARVKEIKPREIKIEEVKFVITTYDHCLVAFPWQGWLDLEDKFSKIANPSGQVRTFRRLFIGGAEEQSFDTQGRVRLSSDHRSYANLDKDVTIIGLINRFEIWNPTILKASLEEQSFDDIATELANSGIDFGL